MLLVFDSNEYIFAFGLLKDQNCKNLITFIQEKYLIHTLRIPRTIVEEVRVHLTQESFKEFILFISILATIDEDTAVPFELGVKYELLGFKPPDAFISAYTEWVGANALITENRHFLSRRKDLPFKVLKAEEFLSQL